MERRKITNQYMDLYEAVKQFIEAEGVDLETVSENMGKTRAQVSSFISSKEYASMSSCRRLADALGCELNILLYDPQKKQDFRGLNDFLGSLTDSPQDQQRAHKAFELIPSIARDENVWRESPEKRITTRKVYQLARSIDCIPLFELVSRATGIAYSVRRERLRAISRKLDKKKDK